MIDLSKSFGAVMALLAVLQLLVLLPANIYLGLTGHPTSFLFALMNLVFGAWAAVIAAEELA